MTKRYYAIVGGTFVVPLLEISATDFFEIVEGREDRGVIAAVPVYFCPGHGVWPTPMSDCKVVVEVDPSEI